MWIAVSAFGRARGLERRGKTCATRRGRWRVSFKHACMHLCEQVGLKISSSSSVVGNYRSATVEA